MSDTGSVGEQQSYETATARVDEIIRRLDSGEASLAETLSLVKEGKGLIERCAGELEEVAGALEELRLDELVARLEREDPGAGRTGPTRSSEADRP
jgi:exodeoxyribonuclease VII small subunit